MVDDIRKIFERSGSSIHAGSWHNIGFVIQKTSGFPFSDHTSLDNLPDEVASIHVELHHFLPSLMVVTLGVQLKPDVTGKFLELLNGTYLSKVRFRSLIPWKAWRSFSTSHFDAEKQQALSDWIESLSERVELRLRPFLSGHFTLTRGDSKARLPALFVFGIRDAPKTNSALFKWFDRNRLWLESVLLGSLFTTFRSQSLIFLPRENRYRKLHSDSVNKLIVLWEKELAKYGEREGEFEERLVLNESLERGMLHSLAVRTGMIEYLESIQTVVEQIRGETFGRTRASRRLRSNMRFFGEVLKAAMLLERVALEFDEHKQIFGNRIASLQELTPYLWNKKRTEPSLFERTNEYVEWKIAKLQRHLRFVHSTFSNFLELENLKSANRLQFYVFWLSIIATIASVIAAVASWPSIKQTFSPEAPVIEKRKEE